MKEKLKVSGIIFLEKGNQIEHNKIMAEKKEAKLLEKEEYKIKYGTRTEENRAKAKKEIVRLEREWMQLTDRLTVNAKRCENIVSRINNLKFV